MLVGNLNLYSRSRGGRCGDRRGAVRHGRPSSTVTGGVLTAEGGRGGEGGPSKGRGRGQGRGCAHAADATVVDSARFTPFAAPRMVLAEGDSSP